MAERHHYGLRQIDVAERLGMTRERLAFLETAGKEVEPTEEWAALYMAALKEG